MKILIDTNIIVDVALIRQPFFDDSDRILVFSEQGSLQGYISAATFGDLYYLLRKSRGKDWTLRFLRRLVTFCQIATVDDAVIRQALAGDFKDFEDAIQYNAAIASQLDGIVTRNPKDFPDTTIPIFTPQKLIEAMEATK
jgi:predicted nucleic acid-binding protein